MGRIIESAHIEENYIADALEVDPSDLIKGKLFSDDVLK